MPSLKPWLALTLSMVTTRTSALCYSLSRRLSRRLCGRGFSRFIGQHLVGADHLLSDGTTSNDAARADWG